MKRLALVLLIFMLVPAKSASADWRWAEPKFKLKRVKPVCKLSICKELAKAKARADRRARIRYYHARKRNEWKMWTSIPIPKCTWYGESGTGPRYSRKRYTMMNSMGSGARGKYQFMPKTYFSVAKYGDWSPLDQEIAVRREYWKNGTWPWTNCH